PPALRVSIRTAVSVVTCRQAPRRTPLRGCSLANRSRTCRRTGIACSAHSILSLPEAASPRSLTSCSVISGPLLAGSDSRVVAEIGHTIQPLPRELRLGAAEVPVGGGLLVERTA